MDLYLDMHGFSNHLNTDAAYNERNIGVGLHTKHDGVLYAAGTYKNSINRRSNYLATGREYPIAKYLHGGVIVGAVTGYSESVFPVLLPYISAGSERFKIRIALMPPAHGMPPAVTFSFQMKISE